MHVVTEKNKFGHLLFQTQNYAFDSMQVNDEVKLSVAPIFCVNSFSCSLSPPTKYNFLVPTCTM